MRFPLPAALAVTLMTGRFHETEAEAQAESLHRASKSPAAIPAVASSVTGSAWQRATLQLFPTPM